MIYCFQVIASVCATTWISAPSIAQSSIVLVAVLVDRLFLFPVDDSGDENGLRFPLLFFAIAISPATRDGYRYRYRSYSFSDPDFDPDLDLIATQFYFFSRQRIDIFGADTLILELKSVEEIKRFVL